MRKLKVGITGGIGSGKSLVTEILKKAGYPILYSDLVAKELMKDSADVRKKIVKLFGPIAYSNDNLNIDFLKKEIFSNEENVKKINSVVHPATTKKINDLTIQLFEKSNIVFVESALIFEAKIKNKFDLIILVTANEKTRIERVMKRDEIKKSSVSEVIKHQMPDEDKTEKSDFVIENNSTIEALEQKTLFVLSLIKTISSSDISYNLIDNLD